MTKKIIAVLVCIVALALCIGIFQYVSKDADENIATDAFEMAADSQDDISAYTEAVEDALAEEQPQAGSETPETTQTAKQTEAPKSVPARVENGILVLGDENAPVTIMEFSSLSCPHCAAFHKNTLSAIKKDYISSGKVKFMFQDFPLNQQALSASLLLKCLDANDRYNFMEMLFAQQEQWAFQADFQTKLKQYAALLGLPNDKADACMSNTETEQEILTRMKAASTRYNISSTPSFVFVPGEKLITGAHPYGSFSTEIENLLK